MKQSKNIAIALTAALSLFAACPETSEYLAPFRAVAHAENEVPLPEVEADLGTPLPIRTHMVYSCPEWATEKRHFSGILIDGPADNYLPLAAALEGYNIEASAVGDEEGPDIIESLYVHRADSLALSFAESRAAYGGGMRGRFAVIGRNYDAATGAELTWDDVFVSRNIVANEVAIVLSRNYAGEPFVTRNVPELAAKVKAILDEGGCSWTLDPCGATFYFNMLSLSEDPYAPIYTASLTFDVNGFCFKEKYRHAPEQWCMEIEPRMPMRVFLGDSILNTIEVKGDVNGIQIIRGGAAATGHDGLRDKDETVFTDPARSNGIHPVLVKMRDGRRYLYVDTLIAPTPEDYEKGYDAQTMKELENRHELRVYDLTGGEIRRVDCDGNFTMRNEWIHDE
ncbi:MAG: hypothetical protein IKW79_03200, partial [Schwartzia sp.]|nr:hypothetical protein [Schwartzia sp. (in: firmicutes)]